MLKLGKKADYGLMALRHLASERAAPACSAKEIAKAYGMPTALVAKILQKLAKTGMLVSQHGTNGGYALARDPSRITAFEVIRALEGPLFITSCVTNRRECDQMTKCTVREPLRKVNDAIVKALREVTVASLIADAPRMLRSEAPSLIQIGFGGGPQ